MARRLALALTAAASLTLAALTAPPASSTAASSTAAGAGIGAGFGIGTGTGRALADRAIVYAATAPYQVHGKAVAAGYVPDTYCVYDRVGGTGALGYPHFNHAYDNSVDPAKPAALYYEDDGRGGKRLVGVQWLVYDRDQKLTTDDDRPTMFGTAFKGPKPGNFPGQPVHYALHLWLWKKNPSGLYATFNPAVRCLPGTTRPTPQT
ncbi:hypothetical protein OG756_29985 [Streptomyces sp. NBC_01310]|uniref:hypothetical protein n=1 Tax=Streptomyces sp. NBC_01310 TaxID=2903820 RepID=UPI0035B59771|nr:hypothetical protein OG756_29985 [Streptomyces sp. NBC_01310]